MIKNIFGTVRFFCCIAGCALLAGLGYAFNWAVKPVVSIVLQNEQLNLLPKEFYVADVADERSTHQPIAQLVADAASGKTQAVDLEGGAGQAVRKFIDRNLPANTALRPVIIRIKELKITETALPGGRVEGKVTVGLTFDRKFTNENVYLLSYKGSARYIRPEKQQDVIEPTLRRALANALVYLNTWVNREADINPKLAKQVKLIFSDHMVNTSPDTVYYNPKRPLTWDDFRAKPPGGGRFAAEVFPSLAFDEEVDVIKSVIHVKLRMKVYMPKTDNWVKPGYRDDYTLNHEQRHFDIVKLVSEHYKRSLLAETQSVTNYDGAIHADYLEAFSEMNRLQKQYDDETRHGIDQYAQAQWNERIDKELHGLGVK